MLTNCNPLCVDNSNIVVVTVALLEAQNNLLRGVSNIFLYGVGELTVKWHNTKGTCPSLTSCGGIILVINAESVQNVNGYKEGKWIGMQVLSSALLLWNFYLKAHQGLINLLAVSTCFFMAQLDAFITKFISLENIL